MLVPQKGDCAHRSLSPDKSQLFRSTSNKNYKNPQRFKGGDYTGALCQDKGEYILRAGAVFQEQIFISLLFNKSPPAALILIGLNAEPGAPVLYCESAVGNAKLDAAG